MDCPDNFRNFHVEPSLKFTDNDLKKRNKRNPVSGSRLVIAAQTATCYNQGMQNIHVEQSRKLHLVSLPTVKSKKIRLWFSQTYQASTITNW